MILSQGSVGEARTARVFQVTIITVAAVVASVTFAQQDDPRSSGLTPFVRFVPASAKLFVDFHRPAEVDSALLQTHAGRLLPLAAGGEGSDQPPSLRAAVARFLGRGSSVDIDELLGSEVGVVADSWSQLGGAVWLARVRSGDVIDRWFPKDQRRGEGQTSVVRSFRTNDGLRVVVRDGIVAMARRSGPRSLLSQTGRLMVGQGGDALEQAQSYHDLAAYLPGRPLATAYAARRRPVEAGSGPRWLIPELDGVAVGMYEHDGHIDFSIRGRRTVPRAGNAITQPAYGRLLRLPRTTLFASATSVDVGRVFREAIGNPSSGVLGRYLALLGVSDEKATSDPGFLDLLGPHVVTAWDQDLTAEDATPQVALMVECQDSAATMREVRRIADRMIELLRVVDPVEPIDAPKILQSAHLGTPITYVSLKQYAERSRFPIMRLLANVEPAWATRGGWFVLALSREHIVRIVDAHCGLIPRLATVPEMQELNFYRANRKTVSVVQPGPAAAALGSWLEAVEKDRPSLLDPTWWRTPSGAARDLRRQIGVEIDPELDPGVVGIIEVQHGAPAEGVLEPDDLILGVNGVLLGLASPASDLSEMLAGAHDTHNPVLRVLREDSMLDVMMTQRPLLLSDRQAPAMMPVEAVRELVSLGRMLEFSSYEVHATGQRDFSARLVLRFTPLESP